MKLVSFVSFLAIFFAVGCQSFNPQANLNYVSQDEAASFQVAVRKAATQKSQADFYNTVTSEIEKISKNELPKWAELVSLVGQELIFLQDGKYHDFTEKGKQYSHSFESSIDEEKPIWYSSDKIMLWENPEGVNESIIEKYKSLFSHVEKLENLGMYVLTIDRKKHIKHAKYYISEIKQESGASLSVNITVGDIKYTKDLVKSFAYKKPIADEIRQRFYRHKFGSEVSKYGGLFEAFIHINMGVSLDTPFETHFAAIPDKYTQELNKGTLSTAIKKDFELNSLGISENATVEVVREGALWKITDKKNFSFPVCLKSVGNWIEIYAK